MSSEEIHFLPYEEAVRIVAAIQEEEDVRQPDHRVLTVYNKDDKEICWFDFDELIRDLGPVEKSEEKEVVSDYIMHHIPDWALDL